MGTNSKYWIYGASGHGKVILDCINANNIQIAGFVDDDISKKTFLNYTVHQSSAINGAADKVIFGIGVNSIRNALAMMHNFNYLTVSHPSASVSPYSSIGRGSVVFNHCVIQSGSSIGQHCIINTKASIDHDCSIGDYVHVSPGAILCGNVTVGDLSWIGAGSVIIQGLKIGKNVMIGAGSVIIRDVPDNVVVVGNPGKIIKHLPI